eukprot:m.357447 g.357447  ORF g.357447 m.357447 type:complete len:193 (+) comp17831_c0_seq1:260-838(+)
MRENAPRDDFVLDAHPFALSQSLKRASPPAFRLTAAERATMKNTEPLALPQLPGRKSFVLDGEKYVNSKGNSKEDFPYTPFMQTGSKEQVSMTTSMTECRRPPGTLGITLSSAELQRPVHFSAPSKVDAPRRPKLKHTQKKEVQTFGLPNFKTIKSKLVTHHSSPYKPHGGDVQIKYAVVAKKKPHRLPPMI